MNSLLYSAVFFRFVHYDVYVLLVFAFNPRGEIKVCLGRFCRTDVFMDLFMLFLVSLFKRRVERSYGRLNAPKALFNENMFLPINFNVYRRV